MEMTKNELVTVLDNSSLASYEIARAVYDHLEKEMRDEVEYASIETMIKNSELICFYLAAKNLGY